jgi:hypothetical protein
VEILLLSSLTGANPSLALHDLEIECSRALDSVILNNRPHGEHLQFHHPQLKEKRLPISMPIGRLQGESVPATAAQSLREEHTRAAARESGRSDI